MASPISFTIELSRCWTTERVMGSILADILALLFALKRQPMHKQLARAVTSTADRAYLIVAGWRRIRSKTPAVPITNTPAMNKSTAGNP